MAKTANDDAIDFEKSLETLENIVETLEKGELPLENALKQFEQGIKLTRQCQKALSDAEQKVKILLEENGQETLEDYDAE